MRATLGGLVMVLVACSGTPAIDAGAGCGADGTPCGEGRACMGGECIDTLCGNGMLDGTEECDDGNDEAFDGCDPGCVFTCDDDRDCDNEDPCNGIETCGEHRCVQGVALEDGASCGAPGGVCNDSQCIAPGCGNGIVSSADGELCDDMNTNPDDGCTNTCRFTCDFELWPGDPVNALGDGGGFEGGVGYELGWAWPDPFPPHWYGDDADIVTERLAMAAISPAGGTHMLQFVATQDMTSSATASESVFLYDLTPWAAEVPTGRLRAHMSALFNRVSAVEGTDTEFAVSLRAYDAARQELPAHINTLFSDNDPGMWECEHVSLVLPPEAAFIRVKVEAREDVENQETERDGPEFDGHFVDNVALWFVLEPAP